MKRNRFLTIALTLAFVLCASGAMAATGYYGDDYRPVWRDLLGVPFLNGDNTSATANVDLVIASNSADRALDPVTRYWTVYYDGTKYTATNYPLLSVDAAGFLEALSQDVAPTESSADLFFIRSGQAARGIGLRIDAPAGGTNTAFDFLYDNFAMSGGAEVTLAGDVALNLEWGKPCCPVICESLYHDVALIETNVPANLSSHDIYVYVPCCKVEKRWQVMPYDKRVHFEDMVLYSASFVGNVELDLGPYVIETPSVWGNMNTDLDAFTSMDYVAERLTNHSPYGMVAKSVAPGYTWGYDPIMETTVSFDVDQRTVALDPKISFITNSNDGLSDANMFKSRRLLTGFETNLATLTTGYYQYILYTDDDDDHYHNLHQGVNQGGEWYRFGVYPSVFASIQAYNLDPGLTQYVGFLPQRSNILNLVQNADNSITAQMAFALKKHDGSEVLEGLCESTDIYPQYWWERGTCVPADGYLHDTTCWSFTPMYFDSLVESNYLASLDITLPDVGYFYTGEAMCTCGTPEWTVVQDPYYPDFFANVNNKYCMSVSFDMAYPDACWTGSFEVLPLKVEVFMEEGQVCSDLTKAAIRKDLAAMQEYTSATCSTDMANRGPIDAFFDNTDGQTISPFFRGYDGAWYDLVALAKQSVADSNKPWLGAKNFFRVWPQSELTGTTYAAGDSQTLPDQMMSVEDAWLAGKQLEFSFYAIFVAKNKPAGGSAVVAKDGYFIIYTGDTVAHSGQRRAITGDVVMATEYTPAPITPTVTVTPTPVVVVTPGAATYVDATEWNFDLISTDLCTIADSVYAGLFGTGYVANSAQLKSAAAILSVDVTGIVSGDLVNYTVNATLPAASAGKVNALLFLALNKTTGKWCTGDTASTAIAAAAAATGKVREGGDYDFDAVETTEKSCVAAIVVEASVTSPTVTPTSGGGGSSGGCNAGLAPMALVLLAPLAFFLKK